MKVSGAGSPRNVVVQTRLVNEHISGSVRFSKQISEGAMYGSLDGPTGKYLEEEPIKLDVVGKDPSVYISSHFDKCAEDNPPHGKTFKISRMAMVSFVEFATRV